MSSFSFISYNLITSPSLRQKPFIIIMIILMMIMLIMTWMKIIMLCWMMIWVLRSVRCLSYSYHVSTELGMKMAPCKAMLLGWCALNVFEGTSSACLSPLIAFNVSKEISLVNLVHALRCSDRSYANNKASSLIHLCWFVMGWMRHIDKYTGHVGKASYHEMDVNKIHRNIKIVHSHHESKKVQHSIWWE